jgi:hypothetical protein
VPWGWIAAAAVGVLIVLANLDDDPDAPSIASSTPSTAFETPASPSLPDSVRSPSDEPSPRAAPAAEWNESRPPVGEDHSLSRDQLRYCLAESTRIDAMEKIVNEYNQADVDTFNRYVNDYNSRCGSFRYRQSALDAVQREVDRARPRLEQEGRARLRAMSGASRQPVSQPDPTVKAVQERLNALGYDAGPADGLAGARTYVAIEAFQKDQGIAVNGSASPALLAALVTARPETQGRAVQSLDSSLGNAATSTDKGNSLPSAKPTDGSQQSISLSDLERASIESACGYDRRMNGPAAYNRCVERQTAALSSVPRTHDRSGLTPLEQESIESACGYDRRMNGPAAYSRCVDRQLTALGQAPRAHDLSELTPTEIDSLESACGYDRRMNGPAAYHSCVSRQLAAVRASPRGHNRQQLTPVEQESLESACGYERRMNGPAAYNRCVDRQLASLNQAPRSIDLTGLAAAERQAIESACGYDRRMNGPAAYNRCLERQLASIDRSK